jgi:hypothetical protein
MGGIVKLVEEGVGALTQAIRNARRRRGQSSRMGPESGQTYGAEVTGRKRGKDVYAPSAPAMRAPDDMSLEATRARMEAAGFDPDSPALYHTTRFGPSISSSPGFLMDYADDMQPGIFTSTNPDATLQYGQLDQWVDMAERGDAFPSESITLPLRYRGELAEVDYPDYLRERFTEEELVRHLRMDPYAIEEAQSLPFRRPIMNKILDDFKGGSEGVRITRMEDILPLEMEMDRDAMMDLGDFEWPDQAVIFNPADLRVPWAGFRPEPDDMKINDLGYANGGALRRLR